MKYTRSELKRIKMSVLKVSKTVLVGNLGDLMFHEKDFRKILSEHYLDAGFSLYKGVVVDIDIDASSSEGVEKEVRVLLDDDEVDNQPFIEAERKAWDEFTKVMEMA